MIKLDVKEYCDNCPDFEPDVDVGCITFVGEGIPVVAGDTHIRCEHAHRCENIYKRIKNESKELNNG